METMMGYPTGPQPVSREERLKTAAAITAKTLERYGDGVIAILAYGSLARGTDGPYSDIEMMCVLRESGVDHTFEWSTGPWKAELNVLGYDTVLAQAAEVEGMWPLTHGQYVNTLALHDPTGFRAELAAVVTGTPQAELDRAVREVILGDLYEDVGKLRNARLRGEAGHLPALAMDMSFYGAMMLGLRARRMYSTGSRVLEEALGYPDPPSGFRELCTAVVSGNLSDPARVTDLCEGFWSGVEPWAKANSIPLYDGGFLDA